MAARTQDEILTRIKEITPHDPLTWNRQLLIGFLDFEHAQPFLVEGTTPEQWEHEADPRAELIDYLDFAWEKVLNKRGISASCSVDKIEQWLWLMGDDALLAEYLAAPYPEYGKPQLAVVTRALAPEKMPTEMKR